MSADLDAEQRAHAIVQCLTEGLHDASVRYECDGGVYEFVIRYLGSDFTFWFPEQALLRKNVKELEQMVFQIADRIRASPTVSSVDEASIAETDEPDAVASSA